MPVELWRARNPSTDTECILHETNWVEHLAIHPETEGHLEAVRQAVADPDFALRDAHGVLYKYRRDHRPGQHRPRWLQVIEGAGEGGTHTVRTAFFITRIKELPVVYARRITVGGRHDGRR